MTVKLIPLCRVYLMEGLPRFCVSAEERRRAGLADGRKPSDSKDYARDERRELLRVAVPVDPLARFSRALRVLLPQ